MTSLTAETFQIANRGRLKAGYIADIVVFDPKMITDHATTENPTALSTGMKYVWVSGVKTLAQGKPTRLRNGKIIRRAGQIEEAQKPIGIFETIDMICQIIANKDENAYPESQCCGDQ